MLQGNKRRIQVRAAQGEVTESLDDQVLQALASHREAQLTQPKPADSTASSAAVVAANRTLVRVPEGLSDAVVALHTVTIEIDYEIASRNFILGSIVRKTVQGGAAGDAFNTMDPDYTDLNVYRVMDARAHAPFPADVVDGNYWPMIDAAIQVLEQLLPAVDVQIWAHEFARVMIETSPDRRLDGLRAWSVSNACREFVDNVGHYLTRPTSALSDLLIHEFCGPYRHQRSPSS